MPSCFSLSTSMWLSQLRRLAPDADASCLGEDEKAERLTDAVACETKMKGMLDVNGGHSIWTANGPKSRWLGYFVDTYMHAIGRSR